MTQYRDKALSSPANRLRLIAGVVVSALQPDEQEQQQQNEHDKRYRSGDLVADGPVYGASKLVLFHGRPFVGAIRGKGVRDALLH